MKKTLLLLMLFLFGLQQFTQAQTPYNKTTEYLKGNSIWAFSHKAGLDFNSGTGVAIASEMPDKGLGEGAASVCDRNTGELLFYTNGETIWNANDQPMPNGDSLWGNGTGIGGGIALSTRQGALIVPFIGDSNKYYVFSLNHVDHAKTNRPNVFMDSNGDTVRGSLFYSIVDMTLENNLGNVVVGQKNMLLDSTALGEAMIAVPGLCGSVWLLVHTAGPPLSDNPPQYKAYEITEAGINSTPVLSTGKIHGTRGWLAVSPDRSTIALNGGGQNLSGTLETGVEVARFNIQTGEVSQAIVIENFDETTNLPPTAQVGFGCIFSPGGNMLYYDIGNYFDTFYLMQCEISNFDSTAIVNSKIRIAANPPNTTLPELTNMGGGFRLYNDTIYIAGNWNGSTPPYYISRINNPNNAGTGCGYETNAILLFPISYPDGGTLGSETVFVPTSDTVMNTLDALICQGWNAGVQLTPMQANGMHFTWSDNSTDSILTINQGGTYWVNYFTEDCNLFYSDTFHITEGNMQQPLINVNVHVLSTSLTYSTYQWLLNDVVINGATQQDYTVLENGFYRVVVTNEQGCIDTSDAYEVTNVDVGIDDMHRLAQQIRVWPNPVKDEVFVRAPVSVNLSMTTISGKIIQQQMATNSLSTLDLAAGIYFLRIMDAKGNLIKVEKLIKANE